MLYVLLCSHNGVLSWRTQGKGPTSSLRKRTRAQFAGFGVGAILGLGSAFDTHAGVKAALAADSVVVYKTGSGSVAVFVDATTSSGTTKTKSEVEADVDVGVIDVKPLFPEAEDENNSALESASSSTRATKKKKINRNNKKKNNNKELSSGEMKGEKNEPTEGEASAPADLIISAQVQDAKERVLILKAYLDEMELFLFPNYPNAVREGIAGKSSSQSKKLLRTRTKILAMEQEQKDINIKKNSAASAVVYNPSKTIKASFPFAITSSSYSLANTNKVSSAERKLKEIADTRKSKSKSKSKREINQGIELKPDYEGLAAYLYIFQEQEHSFAVLTEKLFPYEDALDSFAREELTFEAQTIFLALDDLKYAAKKEQFRPAQKAYARLILG